MPARPCPCPCPVFARAERSVLGHADQRRDDAGEQVTCLLGGVGGDVGAAGHDVKDGEKDDDNGDHNGWGDFRGEQRSNDTHESKTDPEAKLMRKGRGREAKLCFSGHALMDNRNGLLVDLRVSEANGYCERETALEMLAEHANGRVTVGADRGYDTADFVAGCRRQGVTPHVAMNDSRRGSAIDRRTIRHVAYGISQTIRMRIEQVFGWVKSIGGLRRSRFRGKRRTQLAAYMVGAAYNLLRLNKLLTVAP